MSKPLPKIPFHRSGVAIFLDKEVTIDLATVTGDKGVAHLPIPTPLLPIAEAYSTSPAITQYGSATTLAELNGMLGDDFLQYRFFHLVALYPDFTKMGYHHTDTISHAIIYHGDGKRVAAWWMNAMPEVFLCFEEGDDLPPPRDAATKTAGEFNPSELLYALSIMAQHGSMGSDIFVIYNTADRKTVLFNDYEDPTFFMGVHFNPVEQD